MRAMILAAGKGTRLAPLTDTTPKPMLPLGGKPLIEWQLEALARAGVSEVVINVHHLAEQLTSTLGDGSRFDLRIIYSHEATLLETGGGILNALHHFKDEPFWLMNGDIWTDFEFTSLPIEPSGRNLAHLVLVDRPSNRNVGDFEMKNGQITARGTTFVYAGIAALSPALLANHTTIHNPNERQTDRSFSLRDAYFDAIATEQLGGQHHPGIWHDIGTLDQYEYLQTQYRD